MKGKSVTFRPTAEMRDRLERLGKATDRSLTYYLQKAIEAHLPALEEKYKEELAEHDRRLKKFPPPSQQFSVMENEKPRGAKYRPRRS